MSVPHTGKLTAEIRGQRCEFNGDNWTAPEAALTALLNDATASTPKTHMDIKSLARIVLIKAGLWNQSRILDWEGDIWEEELPPEAID